MAKSIRLLKSIYRLLLPVVVLAVIAMTTASIWLVHETAHPSAVGYLVTPQTYGMLSARGAQVTDENWSNKDNTSARGWLLRGAPDAPAVILLHKYGANRSHVLNLGVKLNEATNFTILMPDLRGHGQNPSVNYTSFGSCEADDTLAAIEYLRNLKTPEQFPLVGKEIGVYGLEMGALAAILAAKQEGSIKALALDSVPQNTEIMVASTVEKRFPFASAVTSKFAQYGTRPYFYQGCYRGETSCETAKQLAGRKVLLLGGLDAPAFQESTSKLSKCFPSGSSVESRTDLSPSGFSIINASLELSEAYDQRVIDFFRQALGQQPM